MKKFGAYIQLYIMFQVQNIKSLAQYRTDFLMMVFFTLFSQGCNLGLICIIYSNIPQVGGWTMWEIFLLYGFLLFSEGFINFFFQGAWKITNMIHMAELDRFLVRPVPVGLQLLTAKIDFDGLNKMIIAIAVMAVGFGRCGMEWNVLKATVFCIFLAEACVIRVCMIWITSCISFWMEGKKNSLNYFVISLGEMAKYPMVIYPPIFQGIFGYLIPYAFVSFYPVGYLLGKEGTRAGALGISFFCVLMLAVSCMVLKRGLANYESSSY